MVISCSAYGCKNKWSKQTAVHFHKNAELCEKWISALKRKNFIPTRSSLVCSDHFIKNDYVIKPGMTKKRLKRNAIPSVFNFPLPHELKVMDDENNYPNIKSKIKLAYILSIEGEDNTDEEFANMDEEDRCYILGSIWGERLKLLPLDVRVLVRQLIDKIFKEALMDSLSEKIIVSE